MIHEKALIDLLNPPAAIEEDNTLVLEEQKTFIEKTFRQFGLNGQIIRAYTASQIRVFEFTPAEGEKLSAYKSIQKHLVTGFDTWKILMRLPLPDKEYCAIEIANDCPVTISGSELFNSEQWSNAKGSLPLMLGKNIQGEIVTIDLHQQANLLLLGALGSGKSAFQQLCLFSLLFKHNPQELKLVLITPDLLNFPQAQNLPYLQFPIISTEKYALAALKWLKKEMKRRLKILYEADSSIAQMPNAKKGNGLLFPRIVLFISELSDLGCENFQQIIELLCELAQKSAAVGIHLIIATKRDTLIAAIKTNFPSKIIFQLFRWQDSISVLGERGAEALLGRGDMLYQFMGKTERIQAGYLEEEEIARLIDKLNDLYENERNAPKQLQIEQDDVIFPYLKKALEMFFAGERICISVLQRKLHIGYNCAVKIISCLEEHKIIKRKQPHLYHELLVDTLEKAEKMLHSPAVLEQQEKSLPPDFNAFVYAELKEKISAAVREVLDQELNDFVEIIAATIKERVKRE